MFLLTVTGNQCQMVDLSCYPSYQGCNNTKGSIVSFGNCPFRSRSSSPAIGYFMKTNSAYQIQSD